MGGSWESHRSSDIFGGDQMPKRHDPSNTHLFKAGLEQTLNLKGPDKYFCGASNVNSIND